MERQILKDHYLVFIDNSEASRNCFPVLKLQSLLPNRLSFVSLDK